MSHEGMAAVITAIAKLLLYGLPAGLLVFSSRFRSVLLEFVSRLTWVEWGPLKVQAERTAATVASEVQARLTSVQRRPGDNYTSPWLGMPAGEMIG